MTRGISNKFFDLKATTLGTVIKSLIIIFLGFAIFYIDDRDFFNYRITIGIILLLVIIKCIYFIRVSYQKILEVSINNTAYHKFMLFMVMNIFVIIISFTTDFFCMVQVDPVSLEGIHTKASIAEKIFNCLYFSTLNFSFFGYGDILPVTIPAKVIMMMETLISFMTVILVLSDFISLKESIAAHKERKKTRPAKISGNSPGYFSSKK